MKSELITNVTPLGWHIACERIMVPSLLIYANDNVKSIRSCINQTCKKNHINITKSKKLTSDSGHTPFSRTETAHNIQFTYTKRATGQCTAHIDTATAILRCGRDSLRNISGNDAHKMRNKKSVPLRAIKKVMPNK